MAIDVRSPAGFIDRLMHSASGRKLISEAEREAAAETLARRRDLAGQLTTLNREQEQEVGRRKVEIEGATAAHTKATKALEAAGQALNRVVLAARSASWGYDRKRSAVERELQETAPAEVMALIGELIQLRDDAQRSGYQMRSWHDWTGREHGSSNHESVAAHMAAIRTAMAAAEALKLEYLEPKALADRLKTIRTTIPAIKPPDGPPGAKAEAIQ